jgi:hypothetical protein
MRVLRDWVQGPTKVSACSATNSTFFNIFVRYILYPALLNLHSLVCSQSLVMFCLLACLIDLLWLPSVTAMPVLSPIPQRPQLLHTLVFGWGLKTLESLIPGELPSKHHYSPFFVSLLISSRPDSTD